MSKKKRNIIYIFIAIIGYTIFGIFQLGKSGGPCNAGLLIIVSMPILLVCSFFLLLTFSWIESTEKTKFVIPIILVLISILIWTVHLFYFYQDSILESLLFLGFFEIFNLYMFIYFIKKSVIF